MVLCDLLRDCYIRPLIIKENIVGNFIVCCFCFVVGIFMFFVDEYFLCAIDLSLSLANFICARGWLNNFNKGEYSEKS